MGLPANVKAAQAKLDPKMQEAFARDYLRRRKLLLIAYLLWVLGWHYLYLGKIGLQFAFLTTLGGFLVWGLVDLFRLPGMVARQNEGIVWDLMSQYRTGAEPMARLPEFLT
jgi:hypothetical protein